MPWTETVDQRYDFACDCLRGSSSMTVLCERYGISRKTGYKWLKRFQAAGRLGLEDRARTPLSCPSALSEEVRAFLLGVRARHPTWGAKKLRREIQKHRPDLRAPARSTIGRLLKQEGLVDVAVSVRSERSAARKRSKASRTLAPSTKPNDVWCIDFKGDFRLGDRSKCYPVTITDNATRYLIACRGKSSTRLEGVQQTLLRAFRTHGLPTHLRSDNGTPFGGDGVLGLSYLSVWLIRLGVEPEHIDPGRPDQNGRHERMHRTLKAETTRPPRRSLEAQQRAFNTWRSIYNDERPHEALEFATPGDLYESSSRELQAPVSPVYPGYYETRSVKPKGHFRWKSADVFVGAAFRGERIGLREVDDGVWVVSYGTRDLGVLNERLLKGGNWIRLSPLEGWT